MSLCKKEQLICTVMIIWLWRPTVNIITKDHRCLQYTVPLPDKTPCIGERHVARGGSVSLGIGDDFYFTMSEDTHTGVRGSKINSYGWGSSHNGPFEFIEQIILKCYSLITVLF